MITKENVLEYIATEYSERFEAGGVLENINPNDLDVLENATEDFTFTINEAWGILDFFDVEDIDERLEWFNQIELNIKGIVQLANVDFYVTSCDNCSETLWDAKPDNYRDFQGVLDNTICNIEGELNIGRIEADLCQDCFDKARRILGV